MGYATAVSRIGAVVGAAGGGFILWLHNAPFVALYFSAAIAALAGIFFTMMSRRGRASAQTDVRRA